jgi:AICAR transformylase/IMP cyclohydrolase PurH
MDLRYGLNPQQAANVVPVHADRWPLRILCGVPSYINLLDALNAWQLVREVRQALGRPSAASFKHVSPSGVAVAGPVDDVALHGVDSANPSAVTSAYLRARDSDPRASYGDFAAISHSVDEELADLLAGVVCDGIIAPGFAPGTVETLSRKKNGRFLVLEADESFVLPREEVRDVLGLRLSQGCDDTVLAPALLDDPVCGTLSPVEQQDLLLGMVVLRYTQSNSVCYVRDGMTLGVGAGQQSRVDCTRLAGAKVDTWWLRRHPAVSGLAFRPGVRRQERINWQIRIAEGDLLTGEAGRLAEAVSVAPGELTADHRAQWQARLDGVTFVSDGALRFRDNVDHAHRHGVRCIAEPGGSVRSAEVVQACREHGIALVHTGLRLFRH